MLVFDEKEYAEKILHTKSYNTVKSQGRERCILVRYLTSLGKSEEEIKKTLSLIPMSGGEYLSSRDKDIIYSKILSKANEFDFVTGIRIKIYKEELEVIEDIDDEVLRHLLFIYLVYYKWASNVKDLRFYSKKNDIMMVVENNNDLWKLAGLSKFRVADRYRMCNKLFEKGLYRIDNFKAHNYIYLPFVKNTGELAFEISNYKNVLGEILLYEEPEKYKRCAVCKTVIKKTRSPKKYCMDCAYTENLRKTREKKRGLKTKTSLD